jgi:hypothetical protein
MLDLIYCLAILGFFVAMLALVRGLQRLGRDAALEDPER